MTIWLTVESDQFCKLINDLPVDNEQHVVEMETSLSYR